MKSNKMPFRYESGLERLVNRDVEENSIYEDLSYFIDQINSYEPDSLGLSVFYMPVGSIDLENDKSGYYIKSFIDNLFINVNAGVDRSRFYVLVDAFNHKVTMINQNSLPNNFDLPINQTDNMTVFTYIRLSNNETILSKTNTNSYGVQEGSFDHNDFIGLDFSIGNNIN